MPRLVVEIDDVDRRNARGEEGSDFSTPHPEIIVEGWCYQPPKRDPITIQTYAWFARHVGDLNREAYQLVICDEAHTALGEKTSAAIRSVPEPVFIGMTATEQLIAKQVSDVFPASVDDLPLVDAALAPFAKMPGRAKTGTQPTPERVAG